MSIMIELNKLKDERDALDKQIREKELQLRQEKYYEVVDRLDSLTREQKEFLLSQIKHDSTSCSDEHPMNGLSYVTGTYECRKCMLIEIFNGEHGGNYDFKFNVEISEV